MDQFVIGGGRFKHLTQNQLNKLLDHAYALGINKIDTAPQYKSEKMIGNYLQLNPNFLISTKTEFTRNTLLPLEIIKNFKISLENLRIHNIDCLFFHSTPPALISKANLDEVDFLKSEKLIKKIGYSGGNFELNDLLIKSQLDCLMVTFNALDISDQHLMQQSKAEIYIKRPMANFVFKRDLINEIRSSIKNFLRVKNPIDIQSYQFRFKKMQTKEKSFSKHLEFYTKFITSFYPRANYVFGVSQTQHLDQIMSTIRMLNSELTEDLIIYYNRLQQLSHEFHWKSLP